MNAVVTIAPDSYVEVRPSLVDRLKNLTSETLQLGERTPRMLSDEEYYDHVSANRTVAEALTEGEKSADRDEIDQELNRLTVQAVEWRRESTIRLRDRETNCSPLQAIKASIELESVVPLITEEQLTRAKALDRPTKAQQYTIETAEAHIKDVDRARQASNSFLVWVDFTKGPEEPGLSTSITNNPDLIVKTVRAKKEYDASLVFTRNQINKALEEGRFWNDIAESIINNRRNSPFG